MPYCIGKELLQPATRYKMAERFRVIGKEKLVLLVLSDFDPSGRTSPQLRGRCRTTSASRTSYPQGSLNREQIDRLRCATDDREGDRLRRRLRFAAWVGRVRSLKPSSRRVASDPHRRH